MPRQQRFHSTTCAPTISEDENEDEEDEVEELERTRLLSRPSTMSCSSTQTSSSYPVSKPKPRRAATTFFGATKHEKVLQRRLSWSGNQSFLLNSRKGSVSAFTIGCDIKGQKCSVLVDTQRNQPIAIVQSRDTTAGRKMSFTPIGASAPTLSHVFVDPPFGCEPPSTSKIGLSAMDSAPCQSQDYPKLEYRRCQYKGEKVKRTDYMILNITVIFILVVITLSILFFSLWKGIFWVHFIALGITVLLITVAMVSVKIHFRLKRSGINLFCRQINLRPELANFRSSPVENV